MVVALWHGHVSSFWSPKWHTYSYDATPTHITLTVSTEHVQRLPKTMKSTIRRRREKEKKEKEKKMRRDRYAEVWVNSILIYDKINCRNLINCRYTQLLSSVVVICCRAAITTLLLHTTDTVHAVAVGELILCSIVSHYFHMRILTTAVVRHYICWVLFAHVNDDADVFGISTSRNVRTPLRTPLFPCEEKELENNRFYTR